MTVSETHYLWRFLNGTSSWFCHNNNTTLAQLLTDNTIGCSAVTDSHMFYQWMYNEDTYSVDDKRTIVAHEFTDEPDQDDDPREPNEEKDYLNETSKDEFDDDILLV